MLQWLTRKLLGSTARAGDLALDDEQRLAMPPRVLDAPRPWPRQPPRFRPDRRPVSLPVAMDLRGGGRRPGGAAERPQARNGSGSSRVN